MRFQYHFEPRAAHFPVALIRTATPPALTITSRLTAIAAKYRCADRIRDLAAIQRATRECLPECAVRRQFYERGLFAPVVARVGLRNHGARTRNDFWRNRRRRLHARTLDPTLPPRSPLKGGKREFRQIKNCVPTR